MKDNFHYPFRAMGSPCEIILRGHDETFCRELCTGFESEVRRLEKAYSRFLPDSITSTINQAAGSGSPVNIDEETLRLLDYADTCYAQSNGLFDITCGSLRSIWNYHDLAEKQCLPEQSDIDKALDLVGWEKVERTGNAVALPLAGMEIDFGGIVKEYAADCIAALAEAAGVSSGMIELGGDIRLFGVAGEPAPWSLGIRNPHHTDKPLALLSLGRGGLATSGDYERYTVINGQRFSHILNPKTGWPVSGFSSVSVVAQQCIVAGSAASIAVLMGKAGEGWLAELGLPYLCVNEHGDISGTLSAR